VVLNNNNHEHNPAKVVILVVFRFVVSQYSIIETYPCKLGGCLGRDRIVVGFTTTYAISAYHH